MNTTKFNPDSTEDSDSDRDQEHHHHTILIPNNTTTKTATTTTTSTTTTAIIVASSVIVSSLSSICISRLATILTQLPLSSYPALEFISLAIVTRVPHIINPIQASLNNNNSPPKNQSSTPSASSSTLSSPSSSSNNLNSFHTLPRFTKWRLLIKFTLPIAVLNLITSWSKAHIAGQLSCSTWQAFDIYSLPVAFVVLDRLPSMSQSNPQLFPIISVTTFTVSLLIFNQSVYPSVILLALISATSQALYLIHLKTWLLSFPHLNPSHPLACSSPFSLLFILLPTLFQLLFSSVHPFDNPLGWLPKLDSLNTLSILLYALLRLSERLVENWALYRFRSPLSVLLLLPSRNLASILFSRLSGFYIGRLGSYLSFLVYAFSIWAICLAQLDTNNTTHHQLYRFFSFHSPHNALNNIFTLNKKTLHQDQNHQNHGQQRGHRDPRRRSSTGGLMMHHHDDYHLGTIQEKSAHHDPLILNHHPKRQKQRHHHHHRYRLRGSHQDRQLDQDQPPLSPVRFRKSFPDRDERYDQTGTKQHWLTFFQVLAFGTLPMMMILKLLLRTQLGLPVTEVAIGTVRPPGSVDLVFSYYNEPLHKFSAAVEYVRTKSVFSSQNPRVIVYVKHPNTSLATIRMSVNADEVIRLKNVGREGGTYLTHILRHYNASLRELNPTSSGFQNTLTTTTRLVGRGEEEVSLDEETLEGDDLLGTERISTNSPIIYGLADHTVFMQPEISWHWIAKPRMNLFDPNSTGFLSFGPYLLSVCGQDGLGNGNYERMRDIYTIFHDSFCPPTGQLASYAGQFVVSRRRILKNRYIKYEKMRDLLQAPIEHWIHREGGWLKWKGATDEGEPKIPVGPNAPFLGHALERSWPVVFHCVDPAIAHSCTDDVVDAKICQCHDP